MRRIWVMVGHIGLVSICILGVAGAQSQEARVVGSEQEVRTRLLRIRRSFEEQQKTFRNMRFKADWLQPHIQITREPGKPPGQEDFIEVPDEKILNVLDYQTDKEGRYVMSLEQYVTDAASGKVKSKQHSSKYGFDGQTYRAFYSERQASIFTPEQKFSTGRSLIKPTAFMDHLFDDDLRRALDHPEQVKLCETADGLWILEYSDPKAQYSYQSTLDPKQGFVVVESKRTSKDRHVYTKKTEYKKTKEGFWYPVKGQSSFGTGHELTMNIVEFELNVGKDNYTLEFPRGTLVRDYTRQAKPPEVYRYGQAKKSYEQIVHSGGKLVAGVVTNETGLPVAGVLVRICCHKRLRADGRFSLSFSSQFDVLNTVTDEQGRFAIELEEDGEYNLLFSPKDYAAMIVYDVPVGKADLKVTLSEGGTVTGRLLCIEDGKHAPVPSAQVKIEQDSRNSYSHLGFDRDRTVVTDAQGRFTFDHLRTKMRDLRTSKSEKWEYMPRVWRISYGTLSKAIAFYEGTRIDDIELVVEPDYTHHNSLIGRPLPDLNDVKVDFNPGQMEDKLLLVCFFDMNQRPSRNQVLQLAKRGEELRNRDIAVLLAQTSQMNETKLDKWIETNDIPFPAGTIRGDVKRTEFIWGVESLPWLILTDKKHTVIAEGFGFDDLDAKIKEMTDETP
jgi:hypothetical protein